MSDDFAGAPAEDTASPAQSQPEPVQATHNAPPATDDSDEQFDDDNEPQPGQYSGNRPQTPRDEQPHHEVQSLSPDDRAADEIAARRAGQMVEKILQWQQGRGPVQPGKMFTPQRSDRDKGPRNDRGDRNDKSGRRNRHRNRGRDRDPNQNPNQNQNQNRGNFQPGGQPQFNQRPQQGFNNQGNRPQHPNAPRPQPSQQPRRPDPIVPGHASQPRVDHQSGTQSTPPSPSKPSDAPPIVQHFSPPQSFVPNRSPSAIPMPEDRGSNYAEAMADAAADIYESDAIVKEVPAIEELIPVDLPPVSESLSEGVSLPSAATAVIAPLTPPPQAQRPRGRNWREGDVVPQQAPSNVRKVVLLNSTEPGEIRVAILENGELAEIFMERKSHHQQAGNIYKGRVVNVEPSLQAAFIDLGATRNGFLHASDVIPPHGGYVDILERKPFEKNAPRPDNVRPNVVGGQRDGRPDRGARGATPPSVLAAKSGGPSYSQAQAPYNPQQAGSAPVDGPLMLNRPARPTGRFGPRPSYPAQQPPALGQSPAQAHASPPVPPLSPEQAQSHGANEASFSEHAVPLDIHSYAGPAMPTSGTVPEIGHVEGEPMPVVPGQPTLVQPSGATPQQNPGQAGDGNRRRRRRRGGRGRSNRARFAGPAPMLAPASGQQTATPPPVGASPQEPWWTPNNSALPPHASEEAQIQNALPHRDATSAAPEHTTVQDRDSDEYDGDDEDFPATEHHGESQEQSGAHPHVQEPAPAFDSNKTPLHPQPAVPENFTAHTRDSEAVSPVPQDSAKELSRSSSTPPTETAPPPSSDSGRMPASSEGGGAISEDEERLHMEQAEDLADELEEEEAQPAAHAESAGSSSAEEVSHATTRAHPPVSEDHQDHDRSDDSGSALTEDEEHESPHHSELDSDRTATASVSDVITKSLEPISDLGTSHVEGGSESSGGEQSAVPVQRPAHAPRKPMRKDRSYERRYTIQEMLREGQEVLVQVAKEGIGQKGPALTTYLSLPGRYLVLMPAVSRLGVSKRIDSEEQRRALKDSLAQLNPPDDMGVIVRTAGMGRSTPELQRDLDYLMRAWDGLKEKTKASRAPSLMYQEGDVVTRVFRDVMTEDVSEIVIDDPIVMERAREFLRETSPGSEHKLKLYAESEPLFHRYNVEQQMQRLFNRKVNLKNGGSIVIEQTEALVAIDVNTGRFREKRNQDDTILQTNLEAAREIARQLRLRDIGGLVMIDFIDMEIFEHKRRVERELKAHLARDKAKINVMPVSSLGVVEMTRQRIRHSLRKTLFDRCPHCSGSGHVKSAESIGLEMLREIKSQIRDKTIRRIKVVLNALSAYAVLNQFRKELVRMEEANNIAIEVCGDPSVSLSQMQVSTAREGGDWILKKVSEVDDYVRNP